MTNIALVVLSTLVVTNYTTAYSPGPDGLTETQEPVSITRYHRIGMEGSDAVLWTARETPDKSVADASAETAEITAAMQGERNTLATIAAELNLTAEQVTKIQQYFVADVDALFPALTAQQRTFLNIQRGLVRLLAKDQIKAVRNP